MTEEEKQAQAAERLYTISRETGYTAREITDTITILAPALERTWNMAINDENLWRRREDLYRQTFLLGRFRWYRRLRVWYIQRKVSS